MKAQEKYIKGFEGRYVISNLGYYRKVTNDKKKYGTLNNRKDLVCHLTDNNGVEHMFSMSRLVAEAFIPNPDKKTQVDHIDTNRANNRADNLRWVWPKENAANLKTVLRRKEPGLFTKKRKGKNPCKAILPSGKILYAYSMQELANMIGYSALSVHRCYYGLQSKIGGVITIQPWNVAEQNTLF